MFSLTPLDFIDYNTILILLLTIFNKPTVECRLTQMNFQQIIKNNLQKIYFDIQCNPEFKGKYLNSYIGQSRGKKIFNGIDKMDYKKRGVVQNERI